MYEIQSFLGAVTDRASSKDRNLVCCCLRFVAADKKILTKLSLRHFDSSIEEVHAETALRESYQLMLFLASRHAPRWTSVPRQGICHLEGFTPQSGKPLSRALR